MHFLANENFPLDVVEALRSEGHDVAWIRTDAPGSKDPDILKRAVAENRILLTFDKDFGDLAFQFGCLPPAALSFFDCKQVPPRRWRSWSPPRLIRAPIGSAISAWSTRAESASGLCRLPPPALDFGSDLVQR
jgi:predicted nuclease of predicted toxin-antitoxin system